jgi:ATP-binding cassette subfamily B protein
MIGFTQLFTVAVIIFGGAAIAQSKLDLADLVTYLLSHVTQSEQKGL